MTRACTPSVPRAGRLAFEHTSDEVVDEGFASIEAALPSLGDGPRYETSQMLVFQNQECDHRPRGMRVQPSPAGVRMKRFGLPGRGRVETLP
jgi:hypothetical protein